MDPGSYSPDEKRVHSAASMILDLHPYAPPTEVPARTSPAVRLFSPSAIATHAILLTPVTGGILAMLNHRRLDDARAAWRMVFLYVLPSVFVVVAWLRVRDGSRQNLMRLAVVLWTMLVARILYREHQRSFRAHVASAGRVARGYLATLGALGIVLALFEGTVSSPVGGGTRVEARMAL